MNANNLSNARLLGFVQVRVGSKLYALPVQSVRFERDRATGAPAGGFFADEETPDQYGILVDGDASESDVQAQIKQGSEDAVRHISQRFLN
ncbi:MAG: hypothetical protein ACLQVI_13720 [Polyangiaceae bacterium]|jgi:hypothetical protein